MRAQVPSVIVYKPYDERKATIFDNFESDFIEQFVKKHSYPLLMNFDISVILLYNIKDSKKNFQRRLTYIIFDLKFIN